MTAPEGHIIQVTGKTQVNSYDNLRIYDGGRDGTVLALKNGSVSNINYLSSGNTMTLRFYSSTSYQKKGYVYEGLNLKVTVLSGTYSITCNSDVAGGSASCDQQTAKADEEIQGISVGIGILALLAEFALEGVDVMIDQTLHVLLAGHAVDGEKDGLGRLRSHRINEERHEDSVNLAHQARQVLQDIKVHLDSRRDFAVDAVGLVVVAYIDEFFAGDHFFSF